MESKKEQLENLKKLSVGERFSKLNELRKDLAKSKLDIKLGKSNKSHLLKIVKKDIARLLSVIKTTK